MMYDLEQEVTPLFERQQNATKFITIDRWWTRSSKTYSRLQWIVQWLITWKVDNELYLEQWLCQVVRKFSTTIRMSVQRDFEEILKNTYFVDEKWIKSQTNIFNHLKKYKWINKSNRTYEYFWRMVEFCWADDQQKIRWQKRQLLYINEWNELSYEWEFRQLLLRTTHRIWIDFNPDDDTVWINTEIEQKRFYNKWDVNILVSTYKDNTFLERVVIEEIEYLKVINPNAWRVFWLWEYWKAEGLIFENVTECDDIPEDANFLWFWLDFWFSNHPSALIAVFYYNKSIYLNEEIYATKLTNQNLWNEMTKIWIRKEEVIADSAEPKSIEEIALMWFNIYKAKKWPDSVNAWIKILQSYPIFITKKSVNMWKEARNYCRAKDRNWNTLDYPIDDFNHWWDGVRYVVLKKLPSLIPWKQEKKKRVWKR